LADSLSSRSFHFFDLSQSRSRFDSTDTFFLILQARVHPVAPKSAQVQLELKKGKWSKRFLELKDGTLSHSKSEKVLSLCSLHFRTRLMFRNTFLCRARTRMFYVNSQISPSSTSINRRLYDSKHRNLSSSLSSHDYNERTLKKSLNIAISSASNPLESSTTGSRL
jgi:hypothetical protein